MAPAIEFSSLSKAFRVPVRDSGLTSSLRSVFRREHRDVLAVDDISARIERGEVVGFLGPNGAGKTTTLKMLSGLLEPTNGSIDVLGYRPADRDKNFLRRIALIMGNRNHLQWDLPVVDSFDLHRAIYRVPAERFGAVIDQLVDVLGLGDIVRKPARQLSLGERMKAEIVLGLIHEPEVIFLDEPTLGLDLTMQRRLRNFLADYARDTGATLLLTSHYMADIEALCERVIVIHHGHIVTDGPLADIVRRLNTTKRLTLVPTDEAVPLFTDATTNPAAIVDGRWELSNVDVSASSVSFTVDRADATAVAAHVLRSYQIDDISIEDPPLEATIERVFAGE